MKILFPLVVFLLLVAIYWSASSSVMKREKEGELKAIAEKALEEAQFTDVEIAVDHLDATVFGRVYHHGDILAANGVVDQIPGLRVTSNRIAMTGSDDGSLSGTTRTSFFGDGKVYFLWVSLILAVLGGGLLSVFGIGLGSMIWRNEGTEATLIEKGTEELRRTAAAIRERCDGLEVDLQEAERVKVPMS